MAGVNTKPIWKDFQLPQYARLTSPPTVDVVVIGGGVTGLTAAYYLKRAGKKVCLVERDRLGSGDTGHTTAHLTCVTDMRIKQLIKLFGSEQAALAWYAGQAAIDAIEQIVCEHNINCQFRRIPGFLHASLDGHKDETETLQEEAELAAELGFDVDFVCRAPIVDKPAMRVRNQAKFHTLKYLAVLAAVVDGEGSSVHEHTEVTDVQEDPLAIVAAGIRIKCSDIVIATHVPLMGKTGLASATLLQSRLIAHSTYVVSGRLQAGVVPEVSLWDTSDPYYYLRVDAMPDGDRVIFGGNDHKTGQIDDTKECFDRLEETLHTFLPETAIDRRWSGQVIETNDGLPLIGPTAEHQFVATGFNGNGITFATIAGMMIRDAILGHENPWQELFSVDRAKVRGGTWDYIKQNLNFPYYLIADRVTLPKKLAPEDLAKGEGAVIKVDGQKLACSRDNRGAFHAVSAVCTHLGCLVRWNQAEETWDCPCHGSRFRASGEVLAGPAESPLSPVKAKPIAKTP